MITMSPDRLAEMRQADPDFFAEVDAQRAAGIPIAHAIQDEDDGKVYVSTGPGEPYVLASPFLRELLIAPDFGGIGMVDPLIPGRALRDPILRADHAAKVRQKLLQITARCRPDLMAHPRLGTAADFIAVEALIKYRDKFVTLPDPVARWDTLAGAFFDWLEELPSRRRGGTRH